MIFFFFINNFNSSFVLHILFGISWYCFLIYSNILFDYICGLTIMLSSCCVEPFFIFLNSCFNSLKLWTVHTGCVFLWCNQTFSVSLKKPKESQEQRLFFLSCRLPNVQPQQDILWTGEVWRWDNSADYTWLNRLICAKEECFLALAPKMCPFFPPIGLEWEVS